MARVDGYVRLVQKALPQSATPSVPLSDDHTDGTWVYTDLYDREIAINDAGDFFYRSDDTIFQLGIGTGSGSIGATGATGATGSQGYRAVMNLSYTGSSLTLGTGTITLPIGTPINNLGWQQGTRVRVWNDATHYMEGQITSVIANPQTTGINVNIDYVVGSGSFGVWYVGIAGDTGSGSGGSQTLEQTLQIGNTIGAEIINFGGYANIQSNANAIELAASNTVSGDSYLNKLTVYDDFTSGVEQVAFSAVAGVDKTSSFQITPGNKYEVHQESDIITPLNQQSVTNKLPSTTIEVVTDTEADTEYRRELGVNGTTNGSLVKVKDNTSLEETQIKTDKSAITLSSSAAAGQILANIGITASEITYSIIDTDFYDPHYSAIGTIGTQYTTFGNEYISPNPGFPPYHRRGSFNSKSGPASGNETWAELRSEYLNGSSYAFIRATDLGGAYPANIIQTGDVGSSQYTKIEQNYNQILIESSNTGFYGIQYDDDWSANYSNRSLVDKEYVDNAVAGGGGGAGITYSGRMNYTTYFDTDDSLDYTDTYYNSGRTTFGLDPYYPWIWDQAGKLNVYFPQSVQPAIIAEGGQFGGMFIAADNTAGGQLIGLQSFAHGSQVSGNLGLYSRADGTQSANIGGQFVAYDGILYPGYTGAANTGIFVDVYSGTVDPSIAGLTNSGIQVVVSGRAGDNNYIGQFQDGSEGAGKVLTCIDGTGLATWQTPTPSGGGGTVSQILTQVRNQSGATIHRGKVVYISGSTGALPLITLSQANSEATSARTYGIVRDDISNNGTGYVVAIGAIQNLDTRSTATNPFTVDTLADGNRLYLSPTNAGYVTNVKPSAPNHMVYIGTVIRTSPTAGYIEYQIQNGYELDEIHDVSIPTTPTDGQVLTYEVSTSLWKAKTPTGATPNLTQVLTQGNTASTSIDMNQYPLSNVSVIDADGDVGIHTINMINASLITLMYNT